MDAPCLVPVHGSTHGKFHGSSMTPWNGTETKSTFWDLLERPGKSKPG
jgi:hypothetical protein